MNNNVTCNENPDGNEIHYQGKTYSSQRDFCEQNHLSLRKINDRRRSSGKSFLEEAEDMLDEIAKTGKIRDRRHCPITVDGVSYESISEFCRAVGTRPSTVDSRAKLKEISIEEAASQIARDIRERKMRKVGIDYKGKFYESKQSLFDSLGIEKTTIHRLMKREHLEMEEAIDLWLHKLETGDTFPQNRHKITINEDTFESHKEAFVAYDIPSGAVEARARENGISIERAAEQVFSELQDERHAVTVGGAVYDNAGDCCADLDISIGTMRRVRTRMGYTTEETLLSLYEYKTRGKKKRMSIPPKIKTAVYAKTGGHCYLCGKAITISEMHVDHRVSLKNGGGNELDNLWPTCKTCNMTKTFMNDDEYVQKCREILAHNRKDGGALCVAASN